MWIIDNKFFNTFSGGILIHDLLRVVRIMKRIVVVCFVKSNPISNQSRNP